jgi:transcription-repair coupling factor (superfamily II helicase)
VKKAKKILSALGPTKKSKGSSRTSVASTSPLGLLALHLLQQWRDSGRDGLVFLAEDENRAERLGSVIHSLEPSHDVMVFPRLNTLPFDGLEPSREIAGRRASVLRRLAQTRKPVFLISTAQAVMERLPLPAVWTRLVVSLKRGAKYVEQDLANRLEALGYDLEGEAEYPGAALFHGKTFEIFPAGALGPYRIEHSADTIERIVAVDPKVHDVLSESAELLVDPMSERLAFSNKRAQRTTLPDYCGRARWIADAGVPEHADSWLSTIEEAGRKEAEREYLARAEWKKVLKHLIVLPRKAGYAATPKSRSPVRLGRISVRSLPKRGAQGLGCFLLRRWRRICVRWNVWVVSRPSAHRFGKMLPEGEATWALFWRISTPASWSLVSSRSLS